MYVKCIVFYMVGKTKYAEYVDCIVQMDYSINANGHANMEKSN